MRTKLLPDVLWCRDWSELLMSGVSLQTENISYGNLTSGLKKGTVNSL